jgi:hypothetical protein
MKLTKTAIIGCSAITLSTFVSSVPVPALAQNLVQNGGFVPTGIPLSEHESAYLGTDPSFLGSNGPSSNGPFTVPDWSFNDGYTFVVPDGTAVSTNLKAASGGSLALYPGNGNQTVNDPTGSGWFIAADGAFKVAAIQQTLTGLTVGEQYTVTFYQAAGQQTGFTGSTSDQFLVSFGSESQESTLISINGTATEVTPWEGQSMTFTADSTSDVLSFLPQGNPGEPEPPFALLADVSVTAVPEPLSGFGLGAIIALGLGVCLKKSKLANKK